MTLQVPKNILILGLGYTGRFLLQTRPQEWLSTQVLTTSRSQGQNFVFDLLDESTWDHLPPVAGTIITFPLEPFAKAKSFFDKKKNDLGRIVIMGSTSCLQIDEEGQRVNEDCPITPSLDRVEAELYFKSQGAMLVLASGIYGPGRNPIDWVKKGWVGPSEKYLNLIHGEDLARILWAALKMGQPGTTYLASDGHPHSWKKLITHWQSKGLLPNRVGGPPSRRVSKKIDSSKTLEQLSISLNYPDILG
ncbi:MAG: hypothetical protein KDD33_00520 [Bdellovibrionales bacterium]|nr:hypothetical protein [Bdellovibrionales bacterium]